MPTLIGKVASLSRIWNINTLSWDAWDGSLRAGSFSIGEVTIASALSVTGTVTADAGVNLNTSALATQATLASALTELQSILTKLNASLAVTGTFWQATQPISAVSLPTHGVTGPLTDTELRAAAVPVSYAALLTELQLKADLTETQPVSSATLATAAKQDTMIASLSVLDDFDEADRCKVNPITGQAGVAGGTGVDAATVQRMSLATNIPLPAGANVIGHVVVDEMPAVSANTAADVLEADGDAGYADGELAQTITQTPDGRLRVAIGAFVSDTAESYVDGDIKSLSLTSDGRLRVATVPAAVNLDFFPDFDPFTAAQMNDLYALTLGDSPWP